MCERDGEGGGGDCSRCGGQSVIDGEGGGERLFQMWEPKCERVGKGARWLLVEI